MVMKKRCYLLISKYYLKTFQGFKADILYIMTSDLFSKFGRVTYMAIFYCEWHSLTENVSNSKLYNRHAFADSTCS